MWNNFYSLAKKNNWTCLELMYKTCLCLEFIFELSYMSLLVHLIDVIRTYELICYLF